MLTNPDLLRPHTSGSREPSGNGHGSPGAIAELSRRLRNDRYIRVGLVLLERCGDKHMKDLTLLWGDAQRRSIIEGREVINFGSANFLGLDFHPRLREAITNCVAEWGSHQYCSRAFYSTQWYEQIESRLAAWLDVEDTLLFPCVTKLHAGVLPALAGRGDVLAIDRKSHNSIWAASKIAAAHGAEVREFDAANPASLDEACQRAPRNGCVVVVDGVYSMTGDVPPLASLYTAARRQGGVLYIDDAHGTGVVGPRGRGAAYGALGSLRDVLYVGSLSKAFSALGGFITCTPALKLMFKMRSDTYIFSGPIPAPYLAATGAVLDLVETDEFDRLLDRLHQRIRQLTSGLQQLNLPYHGGVGPIVSVLVGEVERTLAAGYRLFEKGYYVQSVGHPAVPINGGVLRVQVNANHTAETIAGLLAAMAEVADELNIAKTPSHACAR